MAIFGDDIKSLFYEISKKYGYSIREIECDVDYIHLLLQYPPTKSILEVVRNLKQALSYLENG